jgi:hypothetical protein
MEAGNIWSGMSRLMHMSRTHGIFFQYLVAVNPAGCKQMLLSKRIQSALSDDEYMLFDEIAV